MAFRRMTLGGLVFSCINALVLGLIVVMTLYPFLYVVSASLSEQLYIQQGRIGIIPMGFQLEAYKRVLEFPMLGRSYLNTILYTALGTAISLVLTVCAAYPMSKRDLQGRKLMTTIVLIPMLFGGGLIPTFLVVNALGMRDSIWAIVIPAAVTSFYVFIQRTFFEQIPVELEDAAKIDGCSMVQTLVKIILPLAIPSLVTIGLFYAVNEWNSFFPAMIYLNDEKLFPVQILLRAIVIQNQTDQVLVDVFDDKNLLSESIKYSTLVVATLPILIVYPFIQKYFVQGSMMGSIKG
ncbi:putative aldouronate transport system permease protein [Paenibacillus sp. V4I3]|uniref:carbohydrate ABC transporter permease n=1 Tax=unclassified Paenibacillus TaxID=185978 RepID=UPI0027842559|nr:MULTISPECIES: carbohydrate ABC transporter permease [unclassified Paenibacillus]MDQ0875830.1 putative aldouronate transport system permease protein [Paenibacillus sp. V4I3]MDQ0888100.1 putative aldouronate transport system permease protein [Paenibacillus sp. V4I9]